MKSPPYQHSGWNKFTIVEESVYDTDISKIKDKILVNFSVASQNDYLNSSKYQNKGQRTYPYIFDRITTDL